jgi:hypothetical protein
VTIFVFTPLNAALFPCLLDGPNTDENYEYKEIEGDGTMNEQLIDPNTKKEEDHGAHKKPDDKKGDATKEIDENNINAGYQERGNLIEEKEFTCLLFFKRLDLFLLKPWLIRDYEKRQVDLTSQNLCLTFSWKVQRSRNNLINKRMTCGEEM